MLKMSMELSPITPTNDSTLECHIKSQMNIPAGLSLESPTAFIMPVEGGGYVTVEATSRYASDVNYLRERDNENQEGNADEMAGSELLYILSQRFENIPPPMSYTVNRKVSEEDHSTKTPLKRVIMKDKAENTDSQYTKSNLRPLRVCVYMMSNVALDMEVEDGVNCTAVEFVQAIVQEDEVALPRNAVAVFALWMCSPLVEIQLKPQHKPFEMRQRWRDIVRKFSTAATAVQIRDEPTLLLRRNVFLSPKDEERILDPGILELLYEEAKYNILEGRYPCEMENYTTLASLQARIDLGPYNAQTHSVQFFRDRLALYLPEHVRRASWSWLRFSGKKNAPEMKLLDHFKRIPQTTTPKKLMNKYVEFCRGLPYYGAAFFYGQVEQPVRGLISLISHTDLQVLLAINNNGITIMEQFHSTVLLGLRYEDLSWDFAKPSQEDNPDCLPCVFLQFRVLENGLRVTKILQIFSKQAAMMDALISTFVADIKRKLAENEDENLNQPNCEPGDVDDTQMPLTGKRELGHSSVSNKLSKMTLATFDDDGHCIGQMGSWSFTY